MTPEQLKTLDREDTLFLIAHEVMHRLFAVEPDAVRLDHKGDVSVLTTTEEGSFLADMLKLIDDMRSGPTAGGLR